MVKKSPASKSAMQTENAERAAIEKWGPTARLMMIRSVAPALKIFGTIIEWLLRGN